MIAQVHSYCLAGGCDLMMVCDLCVCSDDARFGEPEIRFGSGVVTMVMPWLLGARKAKELLFTGEDRISADEALRIGLVNKVVPADELDAATLALAEEIAKNDPFAIAMQKKAINRAWEVQGFRAAIEANVEIDAMIETADLPEREEFRTDHAGEGTEGGDRVAGRSVPRAAREAARRSSRCWRRARSRSSARRSLPTRGRPEIYRSLRARRVRGRAVSRSTRSTTRCGAARACRRSPSFRAAWTCSCSSFRRGSSCG